MAKAKKAKTLTTEQALEQLLGRKSAKRVRQLAERLANDEDDDSEKGKKARKKR